jgi:SRSO17 transposase
MDIRFVQRRIALLDECQVDIALFAGMCQRLEAFAEPFANLLCRKEQKDHARDYMSGLLSDLKRKNTESIAYRHNQNRRCLQHFIGEAQWEHAPLLMELARQVGQTIGQPDAVLVFDPSGFPKKGAKSVGVKRQWLGRLGKVDNGQVAVYMGYVAQQEHAIVNERLFLPSEWASNRRRRDKCGVPKNIRFQTRHELALQMLDEQSALLPHAWIAGDDEMGRSTAFRRALRARGENYLLAVPSNIKVRDLAAPLPEYCGRGARPKPRFQQVCRWREALGKAAWTRVEVREGEKGPLVVELAKTPVLARTELKNEETAEELLVVMRTLEENGEWKHDYYLSNAGEEVSVTEIARVAKAEHRIEECIERSKSEAGLADYEVRTWSGWHHHQALSLLATWFLVLETLGGKKGDAGADVATSTRRTVAVAA